MAHMTAFRRFDREVTLRRRTQTGTTEANEPEYSEVDIATFWASLIALAEDEAFSTGQRFAKRLVTFRCRWFEGLLETDTLVCEGVTYNVKGFREIGRRSALEIKAEAQH
jgi:hypothetical protein